MCDAFTISTALSIGTAVAGYVGQAQQAAQVAKYNTAATKAANTALADSYAQIGLARQQEFEGASQKIQEVTLEGRRARARARVAAGEAGVSGLSVAALERDFYAQELNYVTSVQSNFARRSAQLTEEAKGARNQTASYLNNLPLPEAPDFFGAALRAGSGAFNAWSTYRRIPTTG